MLFAVAAAARWWLLLLLLLLLDIDGSGGPGWYGLLCCTLASAPENLKMTVAEWLLRRDPHRCLGSGVWKKKKKMDEAARRFLAFDEK